MTAVDYHSHILPFLDDGAKSLQESLAMAKEAAASGFDTVIATPHYETYFHENCRTEILSAVSELQKEIKRARIDLQLKPGSEIMLGPEIPQLLKQNKLMTIADEGTHVLVELPFYTRPLWTDDVLYKIRLLGLVPVLAHPERYQWLRDDLDWLTVCRENGILLQGCLGSLRGKYGQGVTERIGQLEDNELIDLWGSDAHSVRGYQILSNERR